MAPKKRVVAPKKRAHAQVIEIDESNPPRPRARGSKCSLQLDGKASAASGAGVMAPKQRAYAQVNGIDKSSLPRLKASESKLSLQLECEARGLHNYKDLNVDELLICLRVGSIHLTATPEFKKMQQMIELIEREEKVAAAVELRDLEAQKERELRAVAEAARKQRRTTQREEEQRRQKGLHTIMEPALHNCALAKTSTLKLHGVPRSQSAHCRYSEGHRPKRGPRCSGKLLFTCEVCDFDICEGCAKFEKIPAEKREALMQEEAVAQRLCQECEREQSPQRVRLRRLGKHGAGLGKRCEDTYKVQITSRILTPEEDVWPPDFVVWSLEGFRPDGSLIDGGFPRKVFDSSWRTHEEANARAVYLFHFKDPWDKTIDPCGASVEVQRTDGLLWFQTYPPDSIMSWTVAVAPSARFTQR